MQRIPREGVAIRLYGVPVPQARIVRGACHANLGIEGTPATSMFFVRISGFAGSVESWPRTRIRNCQAARTNREETIMPYRRGGFALTPPSVPLFLISLALAAVAVLIRYGSLTIPIINASRVFDVLAIAYLVMLIGVLFRRV